MNGQNQWNNTEIGFFCYSMKELLGASGCRSFSGRLEAVVALIDALQLGPKDCIYLSALAPSEVVKAILACGAIPVFCDVSPDSLTLDHRSLEASVRHTIASEQLYPRAAIVDNFGGMPFAAKAIKGVCDRMGLILIEDCGEGFGGVSDGIPCGAVGDYSLISLGRSSVFGTGGNGCLVVSMHGNAFVRQLEACDGGGYQTADNIYADALAAAFERREEVLSACRKSAQRMEQALVHSDFWMQHGSGRQQSSYARMILIAQDAKQCEAAVASLEDAGLERYVQKLHAHRKSCFEYHCRGFKNIENAAALAPRALCIDLFGAYHAGDAEHLAGQTVEIVRRLTGSETTL